MVRVGTDKKHTHRASIYLGFGENIVEYGFDLTHSMEEGKLLSVLFRDAQLVAKVTHEILQEKDYGLYIPNTGFLYPMPISGLTSEALCCVLQRYSPTMPQECYFRIIKDYEGETLSVNQAAELLIGEYKRFQFMFEVLRQKPSRYSI
jgi:hypothetical protein